MTKTALIVGASRGLGLGLVRDYLIQGWSVVATSRGDSPGLRDLAACAGGKLRLEPLDVTDADGLESLRGSLAEVSLDVLVVCAGMMTDRDSKASDVEPEAFARMMVTNALAPLKIIDSLHERVAADGVIVAMTSVLGSVGGNTRGGVEIYRASKAALNTLLRSYAVRHKDRAIVAMHPGWVRTYMGGAGADLSVEESVAGMVAAIAGRAGKAGCVFIDYRGETIPW